MEQIYITHQGRIDIGLENKKSIGLTPPQTLVIGLITIIFIGALLLTLPQATVEGKGLPLLDAVFTATSAVCVTGLVVVDTGTFFTVFGQIVILILIEMGGLGFMTFATLFAMLLGRKISLKERLLLQEALNQVSLEGIVRLAKYILQISLVIQALGATILMLRWQSDLGWSKAFYFGLFHSISGFNNAGFDLFGNFNSLMSYQSDIITNITLMFLIITGGFGFAVLSDLYTKKGKKLSLHTKVVLYTSGLLIISGAAIIFLLEFSNPATLGGLAPMTKLLATLFQSITPRTAGFNTLPIFAMRDSTQLFIIILMFIGASPGSTGGGIKTTTFVAIVTSVVHTLKGNCQVTIKERHIPKDIVQKAITITFIAMLLVIIVTMFLSITENSDPLTLMFETVSAFGTVGLSMGITPHLSHLGKMAIIFTMFCGRIGPLTLAFALSYKRKTAAAKIKYPEEKLIIG